MTDIHKATDVPAKTQDTPAKPVKAAKKDEVQPQLPATNDAELDAIQPPKNASKNELSNFGKLRKIAEGRGKEISELKPKLTEYETQIKELQEKIKTAVPTLTPEQQQMIDRSNFLQAYFDLQNHPQFKEKYDGKIETNNNLVYDILVANQWGKENVEELKKNGGLMNYVLKGKQFGEDEGKNLLDSSFWNDTIVPNLKPSDRLLVESMIKDNRLTQINRQKALDKAPELNQQYLKERQAEQERYEQTHQAEVMQTIGELEKENPWAARQEILATDSPEIKAQKESQNKYRDEVLEPLFTEAFQATNPMMPAKTRVLVAAHVVRAEFLGRINAGLWEEVQKLRKQVETTEVRANKVKVASTMKSNPAGTASAGATPAKVASWNDDLETAMQKAGI